MYKSKTLFVLIGAISTILLFSCLARRSQLNAPAKWHMLVSKSTTYHARGNDKQAEICLKEAVALAKKMNDNGANLGLTLNNLGEVYARQGKYVNAQKSLEYALHIRRTALGPDSYETALTMRNLANVYDHQGRYQKAKEMLIQAMGIASAARGIGHANAAMFLNDLGIIYIHTQNYQNAEATIRRALSMAEQKGNRKTSASSMTTLAYVCALEGKFHEAGSLARRAVNQSKQIFGPKHIGTLAAESNLGRALLGQKRYDEAQRVFEDALDVTVVTLGRGHPQTALLECSLSTVLIHRHEYAKAEQLCRHALAINEGTLGPLHVETITTRYNLVASLSAQLKYAEADALFNKQIADAERICGPCSSVLAGTLNDYSHFLYGIKRNYEANNAALRAKKICDELHRRRLPVNDGTPAFPVAYSNPVHCTLC